MSAYSIGDWVVHVNYGVGEVRSVETRIISGGEADYYKIKTTDDLFVWVPVSNDDEDYLRELTSPRQIEEVIEVLKNKPRALPQKPYGRQIRIKEAKTSHSILEKARLVRDLWVHNNQKRLGMDELRALKWATQHLVNEWALTVDKKPDEVEKRIIQVLSNAHIA